MNLNNAKKIWFNFKSITGDYVTILFKSLASLIFMDDGTTVEDNINDIKKNYCSSPTLLTSGTFSLNSSIKVTGIKHLLILSFKNSIEIGRHTEILIPNHDDTRHISIIGELSSSTALCIGLNVKWVQNSSSTTATITCNRFEATGHWDGGRSQLVDIYTI